MTIKDHIKGFSVFEYYRDNTLYYQTESGFKFGIPIDDVGTAALNMTEKSIHLMRWIRKHLEMIEKEKNNFNTYEKFR